MKPWVHLFATGGLMAACASGVAPTSLAVAQDSGSSGDATTMTRDTAVQPPADAKPTGAQTWCAELKAKMQLCDGELECGEDFDAWCTRQARTNSQAFEFTDTSCVNTTCKGTERAACRYAGYEAAGMSSAGAALANAYCATCTEVPSCVQSTTTYSKGAALSDAFVAAWELSDTIVDQIRAKCTGTALTVGANGCVKSFGSCAADVYLAALPRCP